MGCGLGTAGSACGAGEARVTHVGELGQEVARGRGEVCQVLSEYRRRVWQLHGTRVMGYAVDAHFEVQVWAGGEAGHAHVTDDLFLLHVHAGTGTRS